MTLAGPIPLLDAASGTPMISASSESNAYQSLLYENEFIFGCTHIFGDLVCRPSGLSVHPHRLSRGDNYSRLAPGHFNGKVLSHNYAQMQLVAQVLD
jgi:hypothetical protein